MDNWIFICTGMSRKWFVDGFPYFILPQRKTLLSSYMNVRSLFFSLIWSSIIKLWCHSLILLCISHFLCPQSYNQHLCLICLPKQWFVNDLMKITSLFYIVIRAHFNRMQVKHPLPALGVARFNWTQVKHLLSALKAKKFSFLDFLFLCIGICYVYISRRPK